MVLAPFLILDLILIFVALCYGDSTEATATGCIVYNLYDGGESKPWPWSVETRVVISLLPEYPGEVFRSLHITLHSHRKEDHVVYFDQYGNVVCREGGRQESSFHQTPDNTSTTQAYHWFHGIMEWHDGTLSINGHVLCSGMLLDHDIYNITLKYGKANGFAAFDCYPGCPIWLSSNMQRYNFPLPRESALVKRKNLHEPSSISITVNTCQTEYQINCKKDITLNKFIGNNWVKIKWQNIVEVQVGDMSQNVEGFYDASVEAGTGVLLGDSNNVLWTFLSQTCTTSMLQMEDLPPLSDQGKVESLYSWCGHNNQLLFFIAIGLGTALVGVISILFIFCIIVNKRHNSNALYSPVDNICDMNMRIISNDDNKQKL